MVNQRDTSISKLLLLPDPSRSPKIEWRNDLFVNIVSTLIVRREREHGRVVLQDLKVPAPLKKTRDHKEHVRQWATPPPRNFPLSYLSFPLSPRILTCIGGAVQCSFTPSFSPAFVKRTNFSTTQEKDYPEWLFSLSLNPDWRGFPKIFFFPSHFITLKLLFSLLLPDLHYIWSGNIRMRKQQKMSPETTQAIKRCIYEWINQPNAIVQIIRRSIKYFKVLSRYETYFYWDAIIQEAMVASSIKVLLLKWNYHYIYIFIYTYNHSIDIIIYHTQRGEGKLKRISVIVQLS